MKKKSSGLKTRKLDLAVDEDHPGDNFPQRFQKEDIEVADVVMVDVIILSVAVPIDDNDCCEQTPLERLHKDCCGQTPTDLNDEMVSLNQSMHLLHQARGLTMELACYTQVGSRGKVATHDAKNGLEVHCEKTTEYSPPVAGLAARSVSCQSVDT